MSTQIDLFPRARSWFGGGAGGPGRGHELLSPEYLALLEAAPWPGNVRELRNQLEQCVVFGEARAPGIPAPPDRGAGAGVDPDLPFEVARRRALDRFEHDYLAALLERTGDNVAAIR